jgi:hypothetical protein
MNRILLVATASPKRVRRKAEELLAGPHGAPTILCGDKPQCLNFYREIAGADVVGLDPGKWSSIVHDLRRRKFAAIYLFWTGETGYRRIKILALLLGAGRIKVDAGDGCVFQLTWKAIIRYWLFRRKHPLPSDHYDFVPQPVPEPPPQPVPEPAPQLAAEPLPEPVPAPAPPPVEHEEPGPFAGQKILILQSAEPPDVLRALAHLNNSPLFSNPRYTLFCRNRPETLKHFQGHKSLAEIRIHHEARDGWRHLRRLRRERFEVAVLFLTGDPSYWKIKCFAFLVGARHKLIFNENNDCFYFTWRAWLSLLSHRLRNRSSLPMPQRWPSQVRVASLVIIKLLVLPFRFAWLLIVWLRLRGSALRPSN